MSNIVAMSRKKICARYVPIVDKRLSFEAEYYRYDSRIFQIDLQLAEIYRYELWGENIIILICEETDFKVIIYS